MRRLFSLLALATVAIAGQGCCNKAASVGWNFQVGKPPTIDTSTILGANAVNYAAQGLASGPVAGQLGLYAADVSPLALRTVERAPERQIERYAAPCPERAPAPRREAAPVPMAAASDDCLTLQDVCRRLDRLAISLERLPRAMGQKPMPGAAKPEDGPEEDD